MTAIFEGSEFVIRDGSGNLKFSTAENIFTITNFVDSRVVGAVSISGRSISATSTIANYTNTTTDYLIGSVNSSATIVFGMLQINTSGAIEDGGATSGNWRQVNGTHMYINNAVGMQRTGVGRTTRSFCATLGLFTFYISGGQLYLRDRFVGRAWAPTSGSWTTTVPSFTVNFRLYCGTFI
jgi:hypothetical protein